MWGAGDINIVRVPIIFSCFVAYPAGMCDDLPILSPYFIYVVTVGSVSWGWCSCFDFSVGAYFT